MRQVTDNTGEVTLAQTYDPFGSLLEQSGAGVSGFGYTSEQEDPSTGLVFLRARYYDLGVGRFLTTDPKPAILELPQSLNAYSYAWNNPLRFIDPTGLQPEYIEFDGISISHDFLLSGEIFLIQDTIQEYQEFLGGKDAFRKNMVLEKIEQGDLADFNGYKNKTVILAPNLLLPYAVSEHRVAEPFSPNRPAAFPNEPPKAFADQNGEYSQAVFFKFILAHEMTHALHEGNNAIFLSFRDEFWPSVPLRCIPFATYRPGPDIDSDPSLTRNAEQGFKGDKLQKEVLADAIAAHLFAPTLLGNRYTDWIENTLPNVLKR